MNMRTTGIYMRRTLLIFTLIAIASPALAQSAPPSTLDLDRYIRELQQNPGDLRLREQIISTALALNPRPAIPEEARRHFVKGTTIQRDAANEGDAELAAGEYSAALLLAPWWGDAYYNLGVAAQMANRFDEALAAFRLYLLTEPPPEDARDAQDRIYAVEAKQELALRAANDAINREAREARQREERNRETLQRFVGRWRTMLPLGSGRSLLDNCNFYDLEMQGSEIIAKAIHTPHNDPRNCGRQRPPMAHLAFTVDGDEIIARILPPLMGAGTVMRGTVNFNEFKVYGPDNARWELYREGTYPVFRPGDCTAALC